MLGRYVMGCWFRVTGIVSGDVGLSELGTQRHVGTTVSLIASFYLVDRGLCLLLLWTETGTCYQVLESRS